MVSPSVEILKTQPDAVLSILLWLTLLEQGAGLELQGILEVEGTGRTPEVSSSLIHSIIYISVSFICCNYVICYFLFFEAKDFQYSSFSFLFGMLKGNHIIPPSSARSRSLLTEVADMPLKVIRD